MSKASHELTSFLNGLNAGLKDAIDTRDPVVHDLLAETVELFAELDAMVQAERQWSHPSRQAPHLTLVE